MREALRGARPVPILTYHSLDDSGSVISVAPGVFREHVQTLLRRGFQGITLRDLLELWAGRRSYPRPVVLTFDDAFASVGEHAVPILRDAGFHATIFAVAGYAGRTNDWPGQPPEIPRLPLLSLSDLRQFSAQGFEIGSHGTHHVCLEGASAAEVHEEIVGSKRRLEDGVGADVGVFAYPYGLADAAARDLARQSYRAACGVEMAVAQPEDDRYSLRRLEMYYFRRPGAFHLFGTGAGRAYVALRAFGRRMRQRLG